MTSRMPVEARGAEARFRRLRRSQWVLSILLPILFIAIILMADVVEGPKTAYVGVLSAIPLLSAIFGTPRTTALVAVMTWASAFFFGHLASDGNVRAQTVRLVIIAIFGVIAVIAALVRTNREVELSEAMTQAAQAEAMRAQAHTDSLTGLLNRRGILDRVEVMRGERATVAAVDIDHFKAINDGHGHNVGDEIIRAVGARISGGLSGQDIVGRWGGDEFVIVLGLGLDLGSDIIDRVFKRVCSEPLATSVGDIPIEISIGVAEWADGESLEGALARADGALYAAKESGRNRFIVAAGV